MERDGDQKEVSGVGDSRCFVCAKRVKKVSESTRLFCDKSLSDPQQGEQKPLSSLSFPTVLSAPLSPLLCRILVFDKGLKNEVKRRQSFQPVEHLSRRRGRPARYFLFTHLIFNNRSCWKQTHACDESALSAAADSLSPG